MILCLVEGVKYSSSVLFLVLLIFVDTLRWYGPARSSGHDRLLAQVGEMRERGVYSRGQSDAPEDSYLRADRLSTRATTVTPKPRNVQPGTLGIHLIAGIKKSGFSPR